MASSAPSLSLTHTQTCQGEIQWADALIASHRGHKTNASHFPPTTQTCKKDINSEEKYLNLNNSETDQKHALVKKNKQTNKNT